MQGVAHFEGETYAETYLDIRVKVLACDQEFNDGQSIVGNCPVDRETVIVIFNKCRLGIGLDAGYHLCTSIWTPTL